jgi:hypothetical protein
MSPQRSRRKPDLFSVLLIAVTIGMTVTLAYQVNLYYGGDAPPIARQGPAETGAGG